MCLRSSAPVWPTCAPVSTSVVAAPSRRRYSSQTFAISRHDRHAPSVRMPTCRPGDRPLETEGRGAAPRRPAPPSGGGPRSCRRSCSYVDRRDICARIQCCRILARCRPARMRDPSLRTRRRGGWPASCTRSIRSPSPTRTATGSATCRGIVEQLDHLEWLGVDAHLAEPDHRLAERRLGLRRRRLLRGRSPSWARSPTSTSSSRPRTRRGSASCSTSSRITRVTSIRGSSTSRSSRTTRRRDWYVWADPDARRFAAEQLGERLRRSGMDARCDHRAVLPAQPPHRAARPELVERRSARRVRRASSGSGSTAVSTDSASTSATSSSRTPSCATTRRRPSTIRSTSQLFGQRPVYNANRPEVHDVLRRWRTIADSYDAAEAAVRRDTGRRRRDPGARSTATTSTSCTSRSTSPSSTRRSRPRRCATSSSASRRISRRARGRPGPGRTTTCRASRPGGRATTRARSASRCSCCSACAELRCSTRATRSACATLRCSTGICGIRWA